MLSAVKEKISVELFIVANEAYIHKNSYLYFTGPIRFPDEISAVVNAKLSPIKRAIVSRFGTGL